jgi:SAM-dependent methyltransferase
MAEFDEFADDYEALLSDAVGWAQEDVGYFPMHKARCLRQLFDDREPESILDFGCGVGGVTRHIAELFPETSVDGFDVSTESIDAVPLDLRRKARFTANPEQLGTAYDAIVVCNVLHHVEPAQRRTIVDGLARRLRLGGHLVVFEHNPLNPVTRWIVRSCAFDENAILLWPRETSNLLQHAGLRRTRRDYVLFFPDFLSQLRPLERRLRRVPLGAQYMMWATK